MLTDDKGVIKDVNSLGYSYFKQLTVKEADTENMCDLKSIGIENHSDEKYQKPAGSKEYLQINGADT
jgi:hypothetical protein